VRTATTIVAALACWVAAYSMFCIKPGGDERTIFENAFKAIGWYFIAKGTLTGLFMSMDDVEHLNRFSRCDCGMNVIRLAILGVLAGGVSDFCLSPTKPESFRQFSLATLLGVVTAVAMICGSIRMYLSIKPWP